MTPDDLAKGVRRLQKRLDQVLLFDPETLDQADPYSTVRPLEAEIETALSETFGHGTIEYNRFAAAKRFDWPIVMGGGIRHSEKVAHVKKDKQRSIQLLQAAIDLLQERIADTGEAGRANDAPVARAKQSSRIFIVHGHDNEPKEATARFISAIGFEPVILHEQANRGRTIIQKFREEASDVGFAIVLMTPDDAMPDGMTRARQNVILELGFFLGALGPDRVAAMVKGQVERPSDFDGVVYIPFDPGWKVAVSKELEAAGYPVDWNIVMRQ
ncbi:TIR domain-containing protein [Neorhizobium vignae]|uniref:TIR domain-containing protein n=1 Tax=Neorhizobium vignae TaxID=690585 RepID=UPI00068FF469|nr:nucleotide-binding protein [Neorhizobium vignae]